MMNYYERKTKKYDAASMALAKLGLLLMLMSVSVEAFIMIAEN